MAPSTFVVVFSPCCGVACVGTIVEKLEVVFVCPVGLWKLVISLKNSKKTVVSKQ